MHVQQTGSDAELISRNLGAARQALVDSQRRIPHGSVAWASVQELITAVDSLSSALGSGSRPSAVLHLTAHSGSRMKDRRIGRREGVPVFGNVRSATRMDGWLEDFAERVLKKGRIGKFDVQALQRQIS